ncbi:hypothetical protein GALL_125010 [mine drainage metagenome]|uniref:Chain length determinant protein n=1 Tax=mine drainage metagenome TaxID=410659 RepID=A0A1J5SAB5_9ZZZZ
MLITIVTLFVVPKYYRSTTVVIPASPALADKARLFNSNIQNLYSFLGNSDDTETLMGIAKLDTVYYQLIDEFKMIDYYETKGDNQNIKRKNTVALLKKDIEINKTEFNQLKIVVWTKDNELSKNIANRMIGIIEETEQNMWKEVYQNNQKKLDESVKDLEAQYQKISDSLSMNTNTFKKEMLESQRQSALEQIKQYQKSSNEIKLAIATTPPALYVIEKAMASASADRPNLLVDLLIVFFASIAFAITAALIYERNQTN